tara:strand:+ start:174 stop:794 length:621 start_codon:yes stop_codon:yes gene_type:complete
MNPQIDIYLADGCGRCPLGGTPDCKVNNWIEELKQLRLIILETGLIEELKWGVPCYTFDKSNVLVMAAFKNYCSVSFFKGVLLEDDKGILAKAGENSQSARLIRFTNVKQVLDLELTLKEYIKKAIEVEKAGLKVHFKNPSEQDIPEEFQHKLDESPELRTAFEALTPGRQRGYLLHFSGAKQSKTRVSRIEKYIPKILEGKGFHD